MLRDSTEIGGTGKELDICLCLWGLAAGLWRSLGPILKEGMFVAPLWTPVPCALYPRPLGSQTGCENCHVSHTRQGSGLRAQFSICCVHLHVRMYGPTYTFLHVCVYVYVSLQLHGKLPGGGQGRMEGGFVPGLRSQETSTSTSSLSHEGLAK